MITEIKDPTDFIVSYDETTGKFRLYDLAKNETSFLGAESDFRIEGYAMSFLSKIVGRSVTTGYAYYTTPFEIDADRQVNLFVRIPGNKKPDEPIFKGYFAEIYEFLNTNRCNPKMVAVITCYSRETVYRFEFENWDYAAKIAPLDFFSIQHAESQDFQGKLPLEIKPLKSSKSRINALGEEKKVKQYLQFFQVAHR